MLPLLLLACLHPASPPAPAPAAEPAQVVPAPDPVLAKLLTLADADGDHAWQRLARLTDDVGARPTGSAAYDAAVAWALAEFDRDEIAARAEPVTQPRWIRGPARLTMTTPRPQELAVLALGGSVGTPKPIEAPVYVAHSFDDLGPHVAGKIVVYNVPMAAGVPAGPHYGPAVQYRAKGAAKAAEHGALAALVRSVTARSLYTPHTGGQWYEEGGPRIPAAAITPEDADQLDRLTARGIQVTLRLDLAASTGPDVASAQVVAEIRGSEKPDEIVLIGAHLDSWDVGQGAQDDGAGVVEVIETMRLVHALGVPPKRTIRAVLFANEEWGLSGGKAYAAAHGHERHVVAMETDLGGGGPVSWGVSGTPEQRAWISTALVPVGLPVEGEGGGADIGPLADFGTLLVGFRPDDSHYFDIHHTHADTVDKIDPAALRASTRVIAGFAWAAANAPDAPPAAPKPAATP